MLISPKTGCYGNVPCEIRKIDPDRSSTIEHLPSGEKNVKIGLVDPEIILIAIFEKEKKEIIASKIARFASLPSWLNSFRVSLMCAQ